MFPVYKFDQNQEERIGLLLFYFLFYLFTFIIIIDTV